MRYYLFLDESGDHGLQTIDISFPVFLLCGILVSEKEYSVIDNRINSIKQKYWNGKKVILHSRDIRRHEKEFKILFDMSIKREFYQELDDIFVSSDYTIICSAIRKDNYIKRHGKLSDDVYEVALSFIIERSIFRLDDFGNCTSLDIIIERRGKKEDKKLDEHFQRIRARGTAYVDSSRIEKIKTTCHFRSKVDDINGLQLADLVAYPCARYVIDKDRANPAFDVVRPKIYSKAEKLYGLKVYP